MTCGDVTAHAHALCFAAFPILWLLLSREARGLVWFDDWLIGRIPFYVPFWIWVAFHLALPKKWKFREELPWNVLHVLGLSWNVENSNHSFYCIFFFGGGGGRVNWKWPWFCEWRLKCSEDTVKVSCSWTRHHKKAAFWGRRGAVSLQIQPLHIGQLWSNPFLSGGSIRAARCEAAVSAG